MDTQKQGLINSKSLFFAVIAFAALSIMMMFLEGAMDLLGKGIFIIWVLLTVSGIGLVLTVNNEKIPGRRKLFLLITGYAAAGFFIFAALHNSFYALSMLNDRFAALDMVLNFLEGLFFIGAVILCPLGILTGIVGTFITWKKAT